MFLLTVDLAHQLLNNWLVHNEEGTMTQNACQQLEVLSEGRRKKSIQDFH